MFLRTLLIFCTLASALWTQAQTVVVQGNVTRVLGSLNVPLPFHQVTIQVDSNTLTALTDTMGFYSVVVSVPVFRPNQLIQVSTLCPSGGPLTQSVPLLQSNSTYQINLACGAGGTGTSTMVSVSGVLMWPTGPAPSGQSVQFFSGNTTAPLGTAITGTGGFFADTLNLTFGTTTSMSLRATASCGNGTVVRDTEMVSAAMPAAIFQLTCASSPSTQITVQGTVLNTNGLPVVSSLVRISLSNTTTVTALTDSSGFYTATLTLPSFLPSNSITVMASCSSPTGPGSTVTGTATYIAGTSLYTVNLSCGSGSRVLIVSGTLVSSSGLGLAGQPVQIFMNQYITPNRFLTTDASGNFADTVTVSSGSGFVYARGACGSNTVWVSDTASYFSGSFSVSLGLQCAPPAGQHRVVGRITGYQSANPMLQDSLSLVVIRLVPPGQGQMPGWTTIDTVYLTDSAGSAFFQLTLPSGRYSLLARLMSGLSTQYTPTYLGDTTTWTAADSFQLPGNSASFLVINLRPQTSGGGTGTIGGGVGGNLPRLSGPLSGIQVQLLNANGTVPTSFRRSTLTNGTGNFQFSGLPWGSYLLRCEHPGMHSMMVPVTLSAQNPSHQSTTFSAGSTGFSITTSVQNLGAETAATLRPNPIVSGQNLHWSLKHETADSDIEAPNTVISWKITDLQGKAHLSEINQGAAFAVEEGGHRGQISSKGLGPGLYLLQLQRSSGSVHQGRFLVLP
jgi:hypothetical protein